MSETNVYNAPKPRFGTNTQYVGVPTYGDEPSPALSPDYYKHDPFLLQAQVDLQSHPQLKGHRSWIKTIIIQFFCLLWAGPVGLLIYLNMRGWIIGASAWCPGRKCYLQSWSIESWIPQMLMAKYDHYNHNLLGSLQLVAKVLEIWFILIASWLVYLITMFLASRKAGLPIAYITRPTEFAEIYGTLDPLLWRTLPQPFRSTGPKKARKRVWIFVIFTVFLGLICNLMGPATAVLVLPSLQWQETAQFPVGGFVSQNSGSPPAPDKSHFFWNYTPNCTSDDFAGDLWSCTALPYANMLDGWVQSYVASKFAINGITQQDAASFAFNSTAWFGADGTEFDFLSWAPNRQTISLLSNDLLKTALISKGYSYEWFVENDVLETGTKAEFDSYATYNNTVQTFIERNGPITGVAVNMWLGYDKLTWWDTWLDDTKKDGIRCYMDYDLSNTPLSRGLLNGTYTKCVKWGTAWNMDYKDAFFTMNGTWKAQVENFGPDIQFDIWTSDRAAFYPNNQLPAGLSPDCLPMFQVVPANLQCDWEAFFQPTNDTILATRSQFVNTIHLSTEYAPVDGHPTSMDLMFDFVAYFNFTTYSLDPSPITNPLFFVTMPDLPMSGTPIPVDPAWTLAAWSADLGGTMAPNRSSAIAVLHAFDRFWDLDLYQSANPLSIYNPNSDYIALLPVIQTLSLIDFSIDPNSTVSSDANHPILYREGRINVWAYGMSSRTAWLGVGVCSFGIVVVIFQCFLGIIDRRPYRSPTELLVAALEHAPSDEFMGRDHDERSIARTPFRVEDHRLGHASRFRFSKSV